MFGFGARKHRQAIASGFKPTCDAFISQIDELRQKSSISDGGLNKFEVFSYVVWVFHYSCVNTGLSISKMKAPLVELDYQANAYAAKHVIIEFPDLDNAQQKRTWEMIIASLNPRVEAYNDAFNRDKVDSFDPSLPDHMVGHHKMQLLIDNCFRNEDNRNRFRDNHEILLILMAQIEQHTLRLLGVKIP